MTIGGSTPTPAPVGTDITITSGSGVSATTNPDSNGDYSFGDLDVKADGTAEVWTVSFPNNTVSAGNTGVLIHTIYGTSPTADIQANIALE